MLGMTFSCDWLQSKEKNCGGAIVNFGLEKLINQIFKNTIE